MARVGFVAVSGVAFDPFQCIHDLHLFPSEEIAGYEFLRGQAKQ